MDGWHHWLNGHESEQTPGDKGQGNLAWGHTGLVESPCSPRDSQESFPTPQCKSINSTVWKGKAPLGMYYYQELTEIIITFSVSNLNFSFVCII